MCEVDCHVLLIDQAGWHVVQAGQSVCALSVDACAQHCVFIPSYQLSQVFQLPSVSGRPGIAPLAAANGTAGKKAGASGGKHMHIV